MKERDILHENNGYYVAKNKNGLYLVFVPKLTYAESEETGYEDLSLAVARCNYLAGRNK